MQTLVVGTHIHIPMKFLKVDPCEQQFGHGLVDPNREGCSMKLCVSFLTAVYPEIRFSGDWVKLHKTPCFPRCLVFSTSRDKAKDRFIHTLVRIHNWHASGPQSFQPLIDKEKYVSEVGRTHP